MSCVAVRPPVPPVNPTNLVVQLSDADEPQKMNGTNGPPFKQVDGYTADLKYEGEDMKERRPDQVVNLDGEDYKIVSITEYEVVLSAPNHKKTTIRYNPSAQTNNPLVPANNSFPLNNSSANTASSTLSQPNNSPPQ